MIQHKGQQLAAIIGLAVILIAAIAVLSTCEMESQYLAVINQQLEEELGLNPDIFVTYNGNGNTGGLVPEDTTAYKKGAEVTVLGNTNGLTKTGFDFTEWNTMADGSGEAYAPDEKLVLGTSSLILYAQWIANPDFYVTYNGNENTGGLVPEDTTAYKKGAEVTVLGNTNGLTKTGHSFAGWNTKSDGSGDDYAAGDILTLGEAGVTLFARWTENPTYTVTYDGNGADGGEAPIDISRYEEGAIVTVKSRGTLTLSGASFISWNTASAGNGTNYIVDSTFSMPTQNITLYAQWSTDPTYTVSYHETTATSGTAPIDSNNYLQNATVTVYGHGNLVKTGYSFSKWTTQEDGSGIPYTAGSTFTMSTANVDLYAQWTANNYTVTLNPSGGTGGTSSVSATYNAAMPGATAPSREGYSFGGYYTGTNGSGTQYYTAAMASSRAWNLTAATTLYAKWTANPYRVTLNQQSGSGGDDIVNVTFGLPMPAASAPTRTGYDFGGYYTETAGGGTQYYTSTMTSARNWNIASDTTLYAKWVGATYLITLDPKGGINGSETVNATYGLAMPSALPPEKAGYSFNGYYTAENGTGIKYYDAGMTSVRNWDQSTASTLYAAWIANTYTITFNRQLGTGGSASVEATFNAAMPAAIPPTRTGYTFSGYYSNPSGIGKQYYSADMDSLCNWDIADNSTLYANWSINQYQVIYHANNAVSGIAPPPVSYDYGTEITVSENNTGLAKIPAAGTAEAFKFGGWNTQADGNGMPYLPGDKFVLGAADFTLYAEWIKFEVGDVGPAGGWIFYDKGVFTSGWRYLEAELPSNTKTWGDNSITTGATGSAIGTGNQNTINIMQNDLSYHNEAAKFCVEYSKTYNTVIFDDWFLPSSGELLQLNSLWLLDYSYYRNYWSSTEVNSQDAVLVDFYEQNSENYGKANGFNCIPTRWF